MTGCIVCSNQHKSGSAQADSDEAAAASQRFTFVLDKNQPGTRNHAMRQYWRERHEAQRGKRPDRRQRRSPPNSGSRSPPKHQRQDISPSSSSEDARYIGQDANQPGIPTQFLTGANHALASSRLDPFDVFPVRLTRLSTHATMMFETVPIRAFNPMRDVWFPLDLSNAASFNTIMAHSAAHLAYFYGGTGPFHGTNSPVALQFKSDAVGILNQWLGDPGRALSNETFAAVTRLLTFERYWGTPEEWEIHRNGLQSMIEERGGLDKLHDDWRLELVVGLLMSRPSWFESTNDISRILESPIHRTIAGASLDLNKIRSLWLISFIQDIRTLMNVASRQYMEGLSIFPSLYHALLLVRMDFENQAQKNFSFASSSYDRLTCLFSVSVMVQESISSASVIPSTSTDSLALLDASLGASLDTWGSSVHNLTRFLHHHILNFCPDGAHKISYILHTIEVISHLSIEAQRGVEKCLLNILCRSSSGYVMFLADDGWTPDSLLSSVHGR